MGFPNFFGQIFASKWGFRNVFKKTIHSIDLIPGIYPYGVNLLTYIHCHVPTVNFGIFLDKAGTVIRAEVYCPHLWAQLVRTW